jgi:hypothetical protein
VTRSYRVCAPAVVSEVIDGEAIIMDLRSGNYFSADGAGARLWEVIALGCAHDDIQAWAAAAFEGDAATIGAGVDAFLDQLTGHGLIEVEDPPRNTPAPAPAARESYRVPLVAVYTDMQDLLLLDPIHDVDEAGWPTRKVDDPPA